MFLTLPYNVSLPLSTISPNQIRLWFFRGLEIHLASFVEAFRLLKLFNSPESNSGTSLFLPPLFSPPPLCAWLYTFEHLAAESMYVHNISKIGRLEICDEFVIQFQYLMTVLGKSFLCSTTMRCRTEIIISEALLTVYLTESLSIYLIILIIMRRIF